MSSNIQKTGIKKTSSYIKPKKVEKSQIKIWIIPKEN
jgi:hypothetical protein